MRTVTNYSSPVGVSPTPQISALSRAEGRWNALSMGTDILQEFAAFQRSKGLAETTVRNRQSILTSVQKAVGRPLLELTIHDLRAYLGKAGLSRGSTRTYRGAIVAFYAFAVDEGLLDADPSVRLVPITAPKGVPRPFTIEQVNRMLTSGAYRHTRAMILVGYYQGFRVSSIAAIHGDDLDIESATIRTIGKGRKERTLPLHPVIAALATTMPAHDWWFPARLGRPGHIHPSGVTECITRAKVRAGITDPTLTPHSLRHGFGTDLVDHGVDIRVVQELMMHESLATTQIYTGVSDRLKREGIRSLPSRSIPIRSGRTLPQAA